MVFKLLALSAILAVLGCGSQKQSQSMDISLDSPNNRQILFQQNQTVFLKTCSDTSGPTNRGCASREPMLSLPYSEYRLALAEAYDVQGYELSEQQIAQLRHEVTEIQQEIDSGGLTPAEEQRARSRILDLRSVETKLASPVNLLRYLQSGVDTSVRDYRDDYAKLAFAFFNWTDVASGLHWRYVGEHNWYDARSACNQLGPNWIMPNHKVTDTLRKISDSEATAIFTSRLSNTMRPITIGNSGSGKAFWSYFDSGNVDAVYWYLLDRGNYAEREITPRNSTIMSTLCFSR